MPGLLEQIDLDQPTNGHLRPPVADVLRDLLHAALDHAERFGPTTRADKLRALDTVKDDLMNLHSKR